MHEKRMNTNIPSRREHTYTRSTKYSKYKISKTLQPNQIRGKISGLFVRAEFCHLGDESK
jgi:hypothetical protein